MKERVIVNDVGPRDGLQNQPDVLEPGQRLRMIRALLDAGMQHIEVAAFVSPKAVPAMAGAAEIVQKLIDVDAELSVLVPNFKGYELAVAAGARCVAMVGYGTDEMAQANVRMNRAQTDEALAAILAQARRDGVGVLATISVSFECPYSGPVEPAIIEEMTDRYLEWGVDAVIIADTIGAATPRQVAQLTSRLVSRHGAEQLGCHFHDTRALGLANVYAAVEAGIRRFDSSIGGLGGCPFAPGASGNVATEDVVMLLHQLGFETGIELSGLMRATRVARELVPATPGGRASAWLEKNLVST